MLGCSFSMSAFNFASQYISLSNIVFFLGGVKATEVIPWFLHYLAVGNHLRYFVFLFLILNVQFLARLIASHFTILSDS